MFDLKRKIFSIISVLAFICLNVIPSKTMALLLVIIFAFAITIIFTNKTDTKLLGKPLKYISFMFSLAICAWGVKNFYSTWIPSRKVQAIATALNIPKTFLIISLSLLGGIVGLYAIYYFSCLFFDFITTKCLNDLPYKDKKSIFTNSKHNFFFVISAAAFFCLYFSNPKTWIVGFFISIILWSLVASQIKSVFAYAKKTKTYLRILAATSALGVCWYSSIHFYANCIKFGIKFGWIAKFIAIFGACVATYFVYVLILFVYNQLIKRIPLVKGLKRYEIVVYAILIVATIAISSFAFSTSEAFWGTGYSYDIIYTSDSPDLVKGDVFVNLFHPENDLRQPLFAVFSAPFMGIPYFFGKIIGAAPFLQAILNNAIQMILLWMSVFLISKMMNLTPIKRVCFIVLCYSSYTFLLSSLMMEQYIIAFFWLTLAFYSLSVNGKVNQIDFFGASGTLLTSAILLPYVSSDLSKKDYKSWAQNMIKSGISFVAIILAFCRFDVIYNLQSKINQLVGFTGESVSLLNKLNQFTTFVSDCFIAPKAGIRTSTETYASWQLATPDKISLIGVLVIVALIISAFINRKNKSSVIAGAWSAFSVLMLFILGWGTKENGLILYSLYFGWAYMVLLFQIIETIENKLHVKFFIPVFTACIIVVLSLINIPAISELIKFAITYYPR